MQLRRVPGFSYKIDNTHIHRDRAQSGVTMGVTLTLFMINMYIYQIFNAVFR
jgi:hypothetical protein